VQHREFDALVAKLRTGSTSESAPGGGVVVGVLAGPIGSGKRECARRFAASRGLVHMEATAVVDTVSAAALGAVVDTAHTRATAQGTVAVLVVDATACVAGPKGCTRQVTEVTQVLVRCVSRSTVLVVVLVHADDIRETADANRTHVVWLGAPMAAADRVAMLATLMTPSASANGRPSAAIEADLEAVASVTRGFTQRDLHRLCRKLWRTSVLQSAQPAANPDLNTQILWDVFLPDIRRHAPPRSLDVQLAIDVPKRAWESVGGYTDVKARLVAMLACRGQRDPAGAVSPKWAGAQPSGVLLYGPSGCGKSLLAGTVVANCGLAVLSVTAPTLMSKYVGDTELQIRSLFSAARQCRPAVIFIDEIDALIQKRGAVGGTTGVSAAVPIPQCARALSLSLLIDCLPCPYRSKSGP
jgi:cytidylate kinase